MTRLFISHSSKDNPETQALHNWLVANGWGAKDDIFLDNHPEAGLVAGDRWREKLYDAADRCIGVLCAISPNWLESGWCREEFRYALSLGKKIFAVVIKPTPRESLPRDILDNFQIVDLTAAGAKETIRLSDEAPGTILFSVRELQRLKTGLKNSGLDANTFIFPKGREISRGLEPLEAEDAAIFFGRGGKIVEALDKLRTLAIEVRERLFVILGASGAGKSSFLRAGLFPRLARDDANWLVLPVVRPGLAAITGEHGLAASLKGAATTLGVAFSAADVESAEKLRDMLRRLQHAARKRLQDDDGKLPVVVLAIDQAEELFTAGSTETVALLELLRPLLRDPLVLLLCMRTDGFQNVQTDPILKELKPAIVSLQPLSRGAFKEVIEGPVRVVSELEGASAPKLDPALTDKLLDDVVVGDSADALPLLAFVLHRLHAQQKSLTLEAYNRSGQLQGAIVDAAAEAMRHPLDPPQIPEDAKVQREVLRKVFIPALARIDEKTNEPRRGIGDYDALSEEMKNLVDRLVRVRLLVKHQPQETPGAATTIEPAHEALLRKWPDLQQWLADERVNLIRLEQLIRASGLWRQNKDRSDWLDHKGARLEEAEDLAKRPDFARDVKGVPLEYLKAARAHEEERIAQEKAASENAFIARSRFAREARRLALEGEGEAALLLGLLALPDGVDEPERPLVALGLGALAQAKFALRTEYVLRGDEAPLSSVAFSSDGTRILTVSFGKTARVWNSATGELVCVLEGHEGSLRDAAFSPDGKHVATAGLDDTARVWDSTTGHERFVLRGHESSVESVSYAPDGARIVTASPDRTARVWDANSGKEVMTLRGKGMMHAARFFPDGSRILTVASDATPHVWDAKTGRELVVLQRWVERLDAKGVAFSPDGKRVALASAGRPTLSNPTAPAEGIAYICDTQTGSEIAALRGHKKPVTLVSYAANGKRIITASLDGTARVWDTAAGQMLVELPGDATNEIGAVGLFADGERAYTASHDRTARVWNVATGKEMIVLRGHELMVRGAALSPDERLATVSSDGTARLWDVTPKRVLHVPNQQVRAAAFSRDGKHLITVLGDRSVRLWDCATGRVLETLLEGKDTVYRVAISPDGSHFALATQNNAVEVWAIAARKQVLALQDQGGGVTAIAISSDGARLALGSRDKLARVFDCATGRAVGELRGHDDAINDLVFSADDARIATASADGSARIWSCSTWRQDLAVRVPAGSVVTVAFSRDGTRLATGSVDKTARIWDAKSGTQLCVVTGEFGGVMGVAFSPDGEQFAATWLDGRTGLWDCATGTEMLTFTGHEQLVAALVFSPDGRQLLVASNDKTARIFDLPPFDQQLIDWARAQVERRHLALSPTRRAELMVPEDAV